jgi:hypothetical protein
MKQICLLMRIACYFILAVLVGMFIWVAGNRLFYPYCVEWMETTVFTESLRVALGQSLYVDPESGFASLIYNPAYQYLVAFFVPLFGATLSIGRVISLISIALASLMIYLIIKDETYSRTAGYVGAFFFIASFPIVAFWYDLVRIDSLWICTLLAGLYFLKRHPTSIGSLAVAAACIGFSFFTKQLTTPAIFIAFFYLLTKGWRHAAIFVAMMAIIVGSGILVLQWSSSGWYWYQVFTLTSGLLGHSGTGAGGMPYNFFYYTRPGDSHMGLFYLVRYYPMCIAVVAFLVVCRMFGARGASRSGLWVLLFAVFIIADGINYTKANAWHNSFYATVAFTSILTGLIWARIDDIGKERPFVALFFCLCLLCQLFMLTYNPDDHIPREQDRVAGDDFIRFVSKLDGDVWLPQHPYYAYLAGKGFRYTAEASCLQYRIIGRLFKRLIDDVKVRKYSYIIIDNEPEWLFWNAIPPLTSVLNANYAVAKKFDYGNVVFKKGLDHRQDWDLPGSRGVFMPVEGCQARPYVLMTPKDQGTLRVSSSRSPLRALSPSRSSAWGRETPHLFSPLRTSGMRARAHSRSHS